MLKKIVNFIIEFPFEIAEDFFGTDVKDLNPFGKLMTWIFNSALIVICGIFCIPTAIIIGGIIFVAISISWVPQFLFIKKERRKSFRAYWRQNFLTLPTNLL